MKAWIFWLERLDEIPGLSPLERLDESALPFLASFFFLAHDVSPRETMISPMPLF